MKLYDLDKARKLIEENKDTLTEASLCIHEDWSWTATPIWEDGAYIKEIVSNEEADVLLGEYREKRKTESLLSMDVEPYDDICLFGGIAGSGWGTPTLELNHKDGKREMIPCYRGESNMSRPQPFDLGVISGPAQEGVPPLKVED